jgi:E3 ubiquitin-protein ligase HERC4
MEALRIHLLLPLYHEFIQAKYYEELQCRFANVVLALKPEAGKVYGKHFRYILELI